MSKWIKFEQKPRIIDQKTDIWYVKSRERELLLGEIMWCASWRSYAFFPESNTMFEDDCLRDIAQFIKDKMDERNKKRIEREQRRILNEKKAH